MRILWHSNAPWAPTGYGAQTGLFTPLIAQHHDLAISAFYGLEGARLNIDGISVYPNAGTNYGNESIQGHVLSHFQGDNRGGLVLTLMDVFVLDAQIFQAYNTACWVPIDHEPPPPGVLAFLRASQATPIAMSRFGQEQLRDLDPLYVPHGVDTKVLRPRERDEARKVTLGGTPVPQDAFVIGAVAANKGVPSRKCLPQILDAFAKFRQGKKNVFLYLHTEIDGKAGGVHLPTLLTQLGLADGSVLFCDQYRYLYDPQGTEYLANVYSSLDVLLNPAMGEGFGIPVLEAQACGVPAIVTDFSAMKEVCGSGWHVEWDRVWTGQGSWQAMPRVDDIVSALEAAYRLPPGAKQQYAEKAVKHASQYDLEVVMREHFLPALDTIEQRITERAPVKLELAA